jgi:hypothetical protein
MAVGAANCWAQDQSALFPPYPIVTEKQVNFDLTQGRPMTVLATPPGASLFYLRESACIPAYLR